MELYEKRHPRRFTASFIVTLLCVIVASLSLGIILLHRFSGCWYVVVVSHQPFKTKSQTSDLSSEPKKTTQHNFPNRFVALSAFKNQKTGKQYLVKGDIVEVLDFNPSGVWLVRRVSRRTEIAFVPGNILKQQQSKKMEHDETDSSQEEEDTDDEVMAYHIMLGNYEAKNDAEVSASIDDEIEVLDDSNKDYWFIDNLSADEDGLVPSYFVEKVTEEQHKRLLKDEGKTKETREQRVNVVNDLVDGERKYVAFLRFIIENHFARMNDDDLPKLLVGKKDELFSNIKEIYSFHTRTFLHELEGCVNDPAELAKVFLRHKIKLNLYIKYLQDRVRSEVVLNVPEVQEFFKKFQDDAKDLLFITEYLDKPVERLNEYKLSLQELLKYTSRANINCKDIEEALEVAATLSLKADSVLSVASLELYSGEIPLQEAGELHRQGSVLFWDDKPRGKGKKREIFLFDKVLINARTKECGKKFICKFAMKISSLGLTEDIEGEPKKWSLWIGNTVHMAVVLHTFEAKTVEAKESWVNAIKEVLEAEGGQKTSRHGKSQSGKQGPALKEKLVTGDGYEDILREVEKQYVIITAPKVAPKPKIRSESLTGSNGVQPKITKSPQYIRAKPGENVVFTCEFTGDPEPAVTWTKNEIPIKDYGRFSIVVQKGYSELSIENIANEDAGQYQIILKNSFGAAWAAGILDMNVPPHMTDPPKGVIGKVGGAALFPCKFEASPQPSITWSKGDVVLESEGRFQIVIDEGFTKLEIDDLQKSDAGNYKVVLKNPAGSEWASAGLVVTRSAEEKDNKIVSSTISEELVPIEDQGSFCTPTVGPSEITSSPQITTAPKGVVAKLGTNVVFSCGYSGDPEPTVTWNKDGNIIESKGRIQIVTKPGSSHVEIDEIVKDDGGVYQIVLKNQWGYAWASAQLVITGDKKPPNITEAPKGQVVKVGGAVVFPCKFEAIPQPNITWSKNNVVIENEGRFEIVIEEGFTKLEIDDLLKSDAGNYKVLLENSAGSAWASAGLVVTGGEEKKGDEERTIGTQKNRNAEMVDGEGTMAKSAPVFSLGLVDCKTKDGNAARFVCRVSGQPSPTIEWFRDDKLLKESRQYSFLNDGSSYTLIITESKESDVGTYKCVAKNSEGSAPSTAKLILEEVSDDAGENSDEDSVIDENAKPVPITKGKAALTYAMKEEIGRGKFGIVKKCIDVTTGTEYAAKFISCRSKAARDEVLHEVNVMNELNHQRLLRLQAVFDADKEIVLIMELITGGELFEQLIQEEYISEGIATFYIKQLLDGLGYMHSKNILHLDLKPENMMLIRPGSKRIKIIDYGLARKYDPNEKLHLMQGTPEFAAPELVGYESITPATDVWAVGVITYVILSGLSPFLGDDDGETMSNISNMLWEFDDPVFDEVTEEAKDFISKILVKNPSKRPTITKCEKHSWLGVKSKKKLETQRLKTFTARRKWKKALTAVRSTNFLSKILSKGGGKNSDGPAAGKGSFLAKIKQQIASEEAEGNAVKNDTKEQEAPPKAESTTKKEEVLKPSHAAGASALFSKIKQATAAEKSENVANNNLPEHKQDLEKPATVTTEKNTGKNSFDKQQGTVQKEDGTALKGESTAKKEVSKPAPGAGSNALLSKIKQGTTTEKSDNAVKKNLPQEKQAAKNLETMSSEKNTEKNKEVETVKKDENTNKKGEQAGKGAAFLAQIKKQSSQEGEKKNPESTVKKAEVAKPSSNHAPAFLAKMKQSTVKESSQTTPDKTNKKEEHVNKPKTIPGKSAVFANFQQKNEVKNNANVAQKNSSAQVNKLPVKGFNFAKKDVNTPQRTEEITKTPEDSIQQAEMSKPEAQVNESIKSAAQPKVPEQSLIIENLKDEHVHKWTALTLTAKVKSSGVKPKITWKKDGKNVAIGRARATYDKGVVTLKIMRAEVNDAGVYTVEIESGSQKCESTATVEIIDPNKANKPNGPSAAKPSFLDKFKPQATIESSQSSVEKHSPEKEETPTKNEGISIENNASEQVNGIVEGEVAGQASEESFLIEKLQDQEVNKWTALTLTCKVKNSGPKPKIAWKKDGKTLGMGRARAAYDKGVATLKIMRAEPHDAGTYTVEIESELKGCQSSATVKVTDAPKAPKKSDGPVVNKGAFLSKYKPPPATKSSDSALKENASAQEESSQKEENTSKENKNISPKENDPTKQEKASNTNAEPQKSEVNDVKDEVESKEAGQSMLIENLQDQQVKKAAPLTLVAKLKDSDAKPKIVWKKDGKTVGMGRARATYDKGVATLKIMRTEFNDAGVYTIEIESGSEKYESTATVEIADVPEPPFPPTASEITPNSAKITWRASKDGNAPISSYLLEYRANADKDWTTVVEEITTTSFVVQDLSPKTGYRFRVSAINKKGTSKPSRLSGIVETKV